MPHLANYCSRCHHAMTGLTSDEVFDILARELTSAQRAVRATELSVFARRIGACGCASPAPVARLEAPGRTVDRSVRPPTLAARQVREEQRAPGLGDGRSPRRRPRLSRRRIPRSRPPLLHRLGLLPSDLETGPWPALWEQADDESRPLSALVAGSAGRIAL